MGAQGARCVCRANCDDVFSRICQAGRVCQSHSLALAYYMLDDWLADFAYRIGLDVSVFVLSSVLAIAIALITVSYQAWKAAQTNPIEALKVRMRSQSAASTSVPNCICSSHILR